jgi:DNA-binding HxlR family transcriptional regulator
MRKELLDRPLRGRGLRRSLRGRGPPRRSDCPISYALDFVGDKWTLIVLRDLIMVRKRYFQEFLASDEKIASNILASRLKLLECAGLVTRQTDPAHGRRVIYAPTEKALDLLPAMLELVRWGAKYDAKTAAPPQLVRRIAEDRDGFVADIRAPHGISIRK